MQGVCVCGGGGAALYGLCHTQRDRLYSRIHIYCIYPSFIDPVHQHFALVLSNYEDHAACAIPAAVILLMTPDDYIVSCLNWVFIPCCM